MGSENIIAVLIIFWPPRLTRLTASFRLSSFGETCAGTFLPPLRNVKHTLTGVFYELVTSC